MNSFFRWSALPYLLLLVALLLCLYLFHEFSPARSLVVAVMLIGWFLFGLLKKDFVIASYLLLLFVVPLNITFSLPQYFEYVGRSLELYDPYIGGVKVNYLIPTLSVIDLSLLLCLFALVKERLYKLSSLQWRFLLITLIYFYWHNIFFLQFVTLVLTIRVIFIVSFGMLTYNLLKKGYLERYTNSFRNLLLGSVIVQVLVGLSQFSLGRSVGLKALGESVFIEGVHGVSFEQLKDSVVLRAYGTFPHPNMLAGFLLVVAIVALWMITSRIAYRRAILLFTLSSFLMVFTLSRTGLIAVMISVIVYGLHDRLKLHKASLKAFVPIGANYERIINLFSFSSQSWIDRINLNRAALEVIKEHPILGVGIGNFINGMGNSAPYTTGGFSLLQPVHNLPLLLLAEHGVVIGLLILIAFVYYLINSSLNSEIRKISLIACFAIAVISMSDHYFLTLPQGNMISLALILLAVQPKLKLLKVNYDI